MLRDGVASIYAARANASGLREQAIALKSTGRNGCGKPIVEAPSWWLSYTSRAESICRRRQRESDRGGADVTQVFTFVNLYT